MWIAAALGLFLALPRAQALSTISYRLLTYNGEFDRCYWDTSNSWDPVWTCASRTTGRLEFTAEDEALIVNALNEILAQFAYQSPANAHYFCTREVTSAWPTIEPYRGRRECQSGEPYEDADASRCEWTALIDLLSLHWAPAWPTLQLAPRFEEETPDDNQPGASPQQSFAGAVGWAWLDRVMRGEAARVQGGWKFEMWYTAEPVLKLNLAPLRKGTFTVRYWAATIVHELLHQMGHRHPRSPGPNFIWGVDECLEYYGDSAQVFEFRSQTGRA